MSKLKTRYLLLIPLISVLLVFSYSNLYNTEKLNFFNKISRTFPEKIFVFDFDLTLTLKDTGTLNLNNNFSLQDIFGGHLDNVERLLKKIKKGNHLIFINTANSIKRVHTILNKAKLINYIDKIYGASSQEEIFHPEKHASLWKEIKNINLEQKWAITKKYYLNIIKSSYPKSIIYFFDDLDINVKTSRECIDNCFIVKSGNIPELIKTVNQFLT